MMTNRPISQAHVHAVAAAEAERQGEELAEELTLLVEQVAGEHRSAVEAQIAATAAGLRAEIKQTVQRFARNAI